MFRNLDPFSEFRYSYFNTITMKFHNDAQGYEQRRDREGTLVTYQISAVLSETRTYCWSEPEKSLPMKRLMLDWSGSSESEIEWTEEVMIRMESSKIWAVERKTDDAGNIAGVCFIIGQRQENRQVLSFIQRRLAVNMLLWQTAHFSEVTARCRLRRRNIFLHEALSPPGSNNQEL
jgi:hypothetical protein